MYTCVGRVKSKNGVITNYTLIDQDGIDETCQVKVKADILKSSIKGGLKVKNLKLTKDDKLIVTDESVIDTIEGEESIWDKQNTVVTYSIQYKDSIETFKEMFKQAISQPVTKELNNALNKTGGFWIEVHNKQRAVRRGTLRQALNELREEVYKEYGTNVGLSVGKIKPISNDVRRAEELINNALSYKQYTIIVKVDIYDEIKQIVYWRIAF